MADGFLSHPFRRLFWSPTLLGVPYYQSALADWFETPTVHILKINVPGCHKDDIKIQLEEGNVLQVSGKAAKPDAPENAVWHVNERSGGQFSREFVLPDNAKVDQIKAQFENGVLTVTVPKETVTKPKTRSISISSKL
ncbi:class I heat shock protein-like isoform X1 [Nymphaea colorata]|nr:class I heat shock protein-like isoform X1 [Nymphaea colorata]XP_031497380.1 class I heat shock protein-like isoform X1 [Nymphaea colorata]XP_031497381.1 class I heat shock protein-like isoform X1 [Nymphaea colorata]